MTLTIPDHLRSRLDEMERLVVVRHFDGDPEQLWVFEVVTTCRRRAPNVDGLIAYAVPQRSSAPYLYIQLVRRERA